MAQEINPGKKEEIKEETKEASSAREIFLFGEKEKQAQSRAQREQFLQDQSLREGFRFLSKSIFQFVFYVGFGTILLVQSRDLHTAHRTLASILMVLGIILVVNGMISLAGLRSK